jgi:hypothetical protein
MTADLQGRRSNRDSSSLIIHLGYLMPARTYTPWIFREENLTESANSLSAALVDYAVPFYLDNASLQSVYEALVDGRYGRIEILNVYRLPVAALLLKRLDEAQERADDGLARLGKGQGKAAQEYRSFYEAVTRAIRDRRKNGATWAARSPP